MTDFLKQPKTPNLGLKTDQQGSSSIKPLADGPGTPPLPPYDDRFLSSMHMNDFIMIRDYLFNRIIEGNRIPTGRQVNDETWAVTTAAYQYGGIGNPNGGVGSTPLQNATYGDFAIAKQTLVTHFVFTYAITAGGFGGNLDAVWQACDFWVHNNTTFSNLINTGNFIRLLQTMTNWDNQMYENKDMKAAFKEDLSFLVSYANEWPFNSFIILDYDPMVQRLTTAPLPTSAELFSVDGNADSHDENTDNDLPVKPEKTDKLEDILTTWYADAATDQGTIASRCISGSTNYAAELNADAYREPDATAYVNTQASLLVQAIASDFNLNSVDMSINHNSEDENNPLLTTSPSKS